MSSLAPASRWSRREARQIGPLLSAGELRRTAGEKITRLWLIRERTAEHRDANLVMPAKLRMKFDRPAVRRAVWSVTQHAHSQNPRMHTNPTRICQLPQVREMAALKGSQADCREATSRQQAPVGLPRGRAQPRERNRALGKARPGGLGPILARALVKA